MTALENLSPIDFEELCRDLAQADTGKRFEAFGPGPDGGVDGRHAKSGKSTILQCKHYHKSSFSDLKKSLRKEVEKVKKLKSSRYFLHTSHSLTRSKKRALQDILGNVLKEPGDIWGSEDIVGALRRHPEIEKSHIKLWLSSAAVLERLLNSGIETFSQATKEEILDELRVYVRNPSFDEAAKRLEKHKILIVSGPPGVGKTTLARMIAYHYLDEGWRFVAINSLKDAFTKIDDSTPTIFFFDDFLGRIALDRQSLLQRDSALAVFIRRVQRSKNARFILTTRAHIFEEARVISGYVDDKRIQLAKYILDVGAYTRKVKSHILFNHLSASELTQAHFRALLQGDWLKKLVDHRNYNPRVIASVSSDCLDGVEPQDYPGFIYHALENPDLIWSKPFDALDTRCQNLLVSLFFGSEYGQELTQLRTNFHDLHRIVSEHYSQPSKPNDFEEAVRILESGFISLSDNEVSFVNPSLRDFLKAYLVQEQYLALMPPAARRADWAIHLWRHIYSLYSTHPEVLMRCSLAFLNFATRIDFFPTLKENEAGFFNSYSTDDSSLSSRISLLLDLWVHSGEENFIKRALELARSDTLMLVPWRDGQDLPELHWRISNYVNEQHPLKHQFLVELERLIVEVLEDSMSTDDLVSVAQRVKEYMEDTISTHVQEVFDSAVEHELQYTEEAINDLDTEESLAEQLELVENLANITGHDATKAKEIII